MEVLTYYLLIVNILKWQKKKKKKKYIYIYIYIYFILCNNF